MSEGSAAIGRTVRAGLAGWSPGVRGCAAALVVGAGLSLLPRFLPPGLSLLDLPLEYAAATLAYGALYRAGFEGPRGWNGLRWGREEWRLLAVQLLIAVIMTVVMAVLFVIIVGVALGVARSTSPDFDATSAQAWRQALSGPGAILAGLVPLASLALLAWIGLRLALAPAATIDRGRIQVLSAFRLTRGAVLTLLAAGLVLVAPAIILAMALGYVRAVVGVSRGAPLAQLLGVGLLFFYLIPVWTAALVDVYSHQTPVAKPPGTAAS
jgi:hypothetical protein